jgi:transcriptional regulator with XRE-family HTH domain
MTIGQRIRAAREEKGWKQRHLAAAIDRSESYVCAIETGAVANPGSEIITAIAQALGVTPNDLLLDAAQSAPSCAEETLSQSASCVNRGNPDA